MKAKSVTYFRESMIQNNYKNSLFYGIQLLKQNKHDDFWRVCFNVVVEYIHILFPKLPFLVYVNYKKCQKIKDFRSIDIFTFKLYLITIKTICLTYKQHISIYICEELKKPKNAKSKKEKELNLELRIRSSFIELKRLLQKIIEKKKESKKKKIYKTTIYNLYKTIADLLSVDCDSFHQFS